MNLKSGLIINNQYQVSNKLGEGGLALIYKAKDIKSKKDIAIKILKKKKISSFLEDKIRFKKEVEIVAKFNHPNIVKIFGSGEYNNVPYIIMDSFMYGYSIYDIRNLFLSTKLCISS